MIEIKSTENQRKIEMAAIGMSIGELEVDYFSSMGRQMGAWEWKSDEDILWLTDRNSGESIPVGRKELEKRGILDKFITRETALYLIRTGQADDKPGMKQVSCFEYGGDDGDFVGMTKDDLESLEEDDGYETFILW